jgi:hypothetical protein
VAVWAAQVVVPADLEGQEVLAVQGEEVRRSCLQEGRAVVSRRVALVAEAEEAGARPAEEGGAAELEGAEGDWPGKP